MFKVETFIRKYSIPIILFNSNFIINFNYDTKKKKKYTEGAEKKKKIEKKRTKE